MENLLAGLRDLQASAEGLAVAMRQVGAEAGLPVEAVGADRTGAIRVWVGADGLPDRAEVSAGWQGRLGPSEFAKAVTQAGRAAVAAQLRQAQESRQSSRPDARGWTERMDRARTAPADRHDPETPVAPQAEEEAPALAE